MIVRAPGRVNLIGDHTDYTGGLVLPMTIDRWTVIDAAAEGNTIELRSADDPIPVHLHLPVDDPAVVEPAWGRYVAGVAAEMRELDGIDGTVSTTIPVGAGLSSSAALEVATALALGFSGTAVALAELCRRAEQRASGVPCGIMDQLAIAAGVDGHALLIDCTTLSVEPIPVPDDVAVLVRFVAHRTLAGSEYADRVAECQAAEEIVGPLATATLDSVATIDDDVVRSRARHVVSENQRVRDFALAFRSGDLAAAGALMVESHRSLRDDYATSTPEMDAAVEDLVGTPGVYGARMTGGGFGGCVVALVDPAIASDIDGWVVRPVAGAHVVPGP